jgi:hypothetical protein
MTGQQMKAKPGQDSRGRPGMKVGLSHPEQGSQDRTTKPDSNGSIADWAQESWGQDSWAHDSWAQESRVSLYRYLLLHIYLILYINRTLRILHI